VPPALEPVREQVLSIVEKLEEFQVSAAKELGIDEEGVPFHVKKEVHLGAAAPRANGPEHGHNLDRQRAHAAPLIEMRTAPAPRRSCVRVRQSSDADAIRGARPVPGLRAPDDGSWIPEHRKV